MQLILAVIRDSKCIETITLDAPKEASFGRKCAAGFADKQFNDDRLSRQHFRVYPEGNSWRLEDLSSRNGTKVQGKLVNACILSDSDEIVAGGLTFRVKMTGMHHESNNTPSGGDQHATPANLIDPDGAIEIATMASRGRLKMVCSSERGESGQTFFRGEFNKVKSAAELVLVLRQTKRLRHPWLIIDLSRLESPLPESLAAGAVPIIDWLSPEYAEGVSPRLLDLKGVPFAEWESLVGEAWGQDAIIVLFSDETQDDLLKVLRKSVQQGTAISGVLWPSVLSYMLVKAQLDPATQMMAVCSGILMEMADLPENWLLIGPPTLQRSLEKLGMVCVAPQEALGTKTDD